MRRRSWVSAIPSPLVDVASRPLGRPHALCELTPLAHDPLVLSRAESALGRYFMAADDGTYDRAEAV